MRRVFEAIRKSGGTAAFKNVAAESVYVFFVYDEKGDWDGTAAPPPQATPIGSYSADGKAPTQVKVAAATEIKGTFGDSMRKGQ